MTSMQSMLLCLLLILTTHQYTNASLDDIIKTHPTIESKFHNTISQEVDILSISTHPNGHTRYEGISYHVVPDSIVEATLHLGEIIWAVIAETDTVVCKFIVKEGDEKYVIRWDIGDEL